MRPRNDPFAVLPQAERKKLRRAPQPRFTAPMLATLTYEHVADPRWIFERKLDGVRGLAFKRGSDVRLLSRNAKDMTATYPELAAALQEQEHDFIVDGEVVAFEGTATSFARLQGRLGISDPERALRRRIAVWYYAFDILHLDGHDTTRLPLLARKRLLRAAITWRGRLRFVAHTNEHGEELLREACKQGWEGLIAKRADSPYVHKRSRDWLKRKCGKRQELVVAGFTEPRGSRERFGALLLGYHDAKGELRYAGKVGTGFDRALLAKLGDRLEQLEQERPPFAAKVREKGAHWVKPVLVAEVAFTEWTEDGKLRHPRFIGLRDDKAASEVVREG